LISLMNTSNINLSEISRQVAQQILFEDNHIIIINKLPSQIIQGDKTGDIPLSGLLKDYIKERYSKPGEVFLGVVHRLDRPVSGVTIFARTSKALSRLNEMLKNHQINKTYWAVVKNQPPEPEGRLISFLKRDEARNKSFVVSENSKNAQRAELVYKTIGKSHTYFLLEVDLLTGRHHQIRTQLSAIGCPIKGDLKYGFSRSNPDGSIHLHARKISFLHPVKKELVSITANPPSDPVWNFFLTNA
jgi:23S rRNA pseudouridine1911/1915/1917 synthase